MQTSVCPYCMKMVVTTDVCPYCGSNINYPGDPMHLPVGTTLMGSRPYVVGACRGQGGFGVTYIALDTESGTRVAIKEYFPTYCSGRNGNTTIRPYFGQEEPYTKGKERFLDEARMVQSLSDLGSVVKVSDFFETNNTAYLVMEFLDGGSLKDHVEKHGKMDAQQLLRQLKPLMADMDAMHRRGVIHRDIAPDNIILQPDGTLKLIDFGAARSYLGEKSMSVVVKKGFAPVEQYMRSGMGAYTDVYALAASIYYCITGIVPPDSAERQFGELGLRSPIELGAALTAEQENALEHALQLQPKDRTQSVSQFLQELLRTEEKPVWEETVYTPPVIENVPPVTEEPKQMPPPVQETYVQKETTHSPREETAYAPPKTQDTPKKSSWGIVVAVIAVMAALVLYVLMFGRTVASGSCGDNLTWKLNAVRVLTISGTGAMDDYEYGETPWNGYCYSITKVKIKDGITAIGDRAFSGYWNLKSITIPDSVTSIGIFAFSNCSGLTSITIPDSVTDIGSCAFECCYSLTSITIPDSVTDIGSYAFEACDSLTSITIPESVTGIGIYAFSRCDSLKKITFTGDAPSIGKYAFTGVTATIYYPAGNKTWTSDVIRQYGGNITWIAY